MKRLQASRVLAISALFMFNQFAVIADERGFHTRLSGFQETPAILTDGKGQFTATLDHSGTSLSYSLTFSGLSTSALVSHIHIGQSSVAGAVMVFLCGGGGKPACPSGGGTVTGTIVASDVLSVPAQGVTAGDFDGFLRVLRSGNSYVNVHSTSHTGGEIRGQLAAED